MSVIKVDSLVSSSDTGPVILEKGGSIPSGQSMTVNGSINVTGIITATSFTGDGSNLTNLGGSPTTTATAFAWSMLFGGYHRA